MKRCAATKDRRRSITGVMGILVMLVAGCAPMGRVHVDLPESAARFPPGPGAEIANSQCLICHSAGMVFTQPPLTEKQWTDSINKMRVAYGAPLPADQVPVLAAYFLQVQATRQRDAAYVPGG